MKYEEFLNCIEELAKMQGYYGRLLTRIKELDEDELTQFKMKVEEQHFKDMLDIVMYFE